MFKNSEKWYIEFLQAHGEVSLVQSTVQDLKILNLLSNTGQREGANPHTGEAPPRECLAFLLKN